MFTVPDEEFAEIIDRSLATLSKDHQAAIKNVAITYADDPTPEQRQKLELRGDQTLFGLYEGVPLAQRQGMTSYGPDRITIFKNPIQEWSHDLASLKEQIRHTVWHEVAHYFGLNHAQIHNLE